MLEFVVGALRLASELSFPRWDLDAKFTADNLFRFVLILEFGRVRFRNLFLASWDKVRD